MPLTERLVKPVLIDAQIAARALPWYVIALLVSQPLHFGDYGGLPLKILWTALDVVTILVLVSGLYLGANGASLWLRNVPAPWRSTRRPAPPSGET